MLTCADCEIGHENCSEQGERIDLYLATGECCDKVISLGIKGRGSVD